MKGIRYLLYKFTLITYWDVRIWRHRAIKINFTITFQVVITRNFPIIMRPPFDSYLTVLCLRGKARVSCSFRTDNLERAVNQGLVTIGKSINYFLQCN